MSHPDPDDYDGCCDVPRQPRRLTTHREPPEYENDTESENIEGDHDDGADTNRCD